MADYNQAISLNPQFADVYVAGGVLQYTNPNDRSGGIADTRQAAKLARLQGNAKILQISLELLQSWGVGNSV